MSKKVEFGIYLPTFARPGYHPTMEELTRFAKTVERMGFTSMWVIDHLLIADPVYRTSWLDPLISLSAIAAVTNRVKLGPGILVLPLRNPAVLAKEYASMDVLTGGRMIFGVGNGWWDKEFEVCGIPKSERGSRCDEYVEIVKMLWTQDNVSYDGRYYRFKGISIYPKPLQKPHPPIWMGGGTAGGKAAEVYKVRAEKVLRRIARLADTWIARCATRPESIPEDWERIQKYASEYERDPKNIGFAHINFIKLVDERDKEMKDAKKAFAKVSSLPWEDIRKQYLVGTREDIADRIDRLAGIGVQHLLMWPTDFDYDALEFLAEEIVPRFR